MSPLGEMSTGHQRNKKVSGCQLLHQSIGGVRLIGLCFQSDGGRSSLHNGQIGTAARGAVPLLIGPVGHGPGVGFFPSQAGGQHGHRRGPAAVAADRIITEGLAGPGFLSLVVVNQIHNSAGQILPPVPGDKLRDLALLRRRDLFNGGRAGQLIHHFIFPRSGKQLLQIAV